jgi:hypothetical protein
VVQLALSSDPSQFGATSNAAIANAAARRLGGDPSLASLAQQPMAQTNAVVPGPQMQMQPMAQSNTTAHLMNPPSTNPSEVKAQPIQYQNPLIGGTGDTKLDSYLGTDSTYQTQLSDLMRNYDQYNAQKNLTASQTQADYDAKQRSLDTQATQDRLNMRNAAAARGILQSGIYANQLGQYNDANQQQLTNLLGGLQNSKDNATMAYNNFVANELASKEQAIQQAAARRSAQLGLV